MQMFYKVISITVFASPSVPSKFWSKKKSPTNKILLNKDFITYSLKVIPASMIGLVVLSASIIPA